MTTGDGTTTTTHTSWDWAATHDDTSTGRVMLVMALDKTRTCHPCMYNHSVHDWQHR